jgi:hypothetical protein
MRSTVVFHLNRQSRTPRRKRFQASNQNKGVATSRQRVSWAPQQDLTLGFDVHDGAVPTVAHQCEWRLLEMCEPSRTGGQGVVCGPAALVGKNRISGRFAFKVGLARVAPQSSPRLERCWEKHLGQIIDAYSKFHRSAGRRVIEGIEGRRYP